MAIAATNREIELIKAQMNAIFSSSYDGMYITDGSGVFLNVNNGLERITGIKKKDLIGKSTHELVTKGIIDHSVVELVLEKKKRCSINQTIKGRLVKEVMVTATPILDDRGAILYIVVNLRDMTDLIHLEEECNRARMLSEKYYSQLMIEKNLFSKIIAESDEMKQLLKIAYRVAQVDSSVLLLGESGVGKEVIAKYIHDVGNRSSNPFISINCTGVPDSLLEAEFFGYEGGSFSGSKKEGKIGLFELADNGILFLDEINSLPMSLQGKLLRVLETHEINRIGGTTPIKINFKIVAASNESLCELVEMNRFRQDLYFRLNVIPIQIQPLRERKKDIVPLVLHFLNYYNKKHNQNKEILTSTFKYLEMYHWPGNVRELKNLIERLIVLSPEKNISPSDLPSEFEIHHNSDCKYKIIINEIVPLDELLEQAERQLLNLVVEKKYSTREIAKVLKVSQTTVVRKLKTIHM